MHVAKANAKFEQREAFDSWKRLLEWQQIDKVGKLSVHQLLMEEPGSPEWTSCDKQNVARSHHYNRTCKVGRLQDDPSRMARLPIIAKL